MTSVSHAVEARRSVRAFLPDPVPPDVLRRVFSTAQRAPSWCNIQPWRVVVTSGEATARLTGRLTSAVKEGRLSTDFPWPGEYPEPYGTHRRECGRALYSAMGVQRGDADGRAHAWMRNFVAFDAPHVAMVGVDKRMMPYAAVDMGCWLQSVMLLCVEEGLATCPQAALATAADEVRGMLGWPAEVGLLFGLAVGYEDRSAAANTCRTTRAAVEENVRFVSE
jgi:nitroreductase